MSLLNDIVQQEFMKFIEMKKIQIPNLLLMLKIVYIVRLVILKSLLKISIGLLPEGAGGPNYANM